MGSQQYWIDELPGAAEAARIDADFMRQMHQAVMAGRRSTATRKLTLQPSQEILDEEQRRAVMRRLERAQAARGAKLVRVAGEAIPCADAPAVTPDTVWSGDYITLVELVRIGLFRLNADAAYTRDLLGSHCAPIGILSAVRRTHEQP